MEGWGLGPPAWRGLASFEVANSIRFLRGWRNRSGSHCFVGVGLANACAVETARASVTSKIRASAFSTAPASAKGPVRPVWQIVAFAHPVRDRLPSSCDHAFESLHHVRYQTITVRRFAFFECEIEMMSLGAMCDANSAASAHTLSHFPKLLSKTR